MKCRLLVLFFLCILILKSNASAATGPEVPGEEVGIDSLYARFAHNKQFDSAMFDASLLAIRYYPELANTAIEFRHKDIPTLMAARPTIWSVFRKKENRKYRIIISTNAQNRSEQIFRNMSRASRIGILGHEYAHIIDYENLTSPGLILFGIRYLFSKKKIECSTDRVAIERGLGTEVLEFTRQIEKSRLPSDRYLRRKDKYYLSKVEIEHLVSKSF